MRSQFSHETMEELRKRVLDLEEQNRVLDAFIENSTDAIQILRPESGDAADQPGL